jgi:regulator of nucleoside diphosphate kinase
MEGRIMVSRQDAARLRALLASQQVQRLHDLEHVAQLESELERASIVERHALPDDRVALHSTVQVRDLDSGVRRVYTLVLPSQADVTRGSISILAPLGTALLGYRAGDEVEWRMPGGPVRLTIEEVR